MQIFPTFVAVLASLLLPMAAQQTETVHSPEVHPDGRVTFRILAPKAAQVTFFGDWMKVGTSQSMKKDAMGTWSLTTGPLPSSIYLYSFSVDGVTIADPVNPRVKLRSRTSASMVEVPSQPPALWQERDVPHGSVSIEWQKSSVLNGQTRSIWIYLPPGYEKAPADRQYPVLYLFHGSNDTAGGWVLAGQANYILDNLLAEGKATPMVVVMPYGHAVPFGSPREMQAKNTPLYEDYILKDVHPLVESKYRVSKDRKYRAIAGLSMGGGQSLHIGLRHLEMFSAVGAFSAAAPADAETVFASALGNARATNEKLKLLWIACGKDDSLLDRNAKFSEVLKARGIRHTFLATDGAHTYTVWRRYLGEFVPLLFR